MAKKKKNPQDYIDDLADDMFKFNQTLKECKDDQEKSKVWFDKQVNAIKSIKGTSWYKEIKHYWTRELISAQAEVMTASTKSQEEYMKASYRSSILMHTAYKFLNFLEWLESYESIDTNSK